MTPRHPRPVGVAAGEESRPREDFYRRVLDVLGAAGVPFLVGGTHALAYLTGLPYRTKDFDVLIRRDDYARSGRALADAGYPTALTHPHFLGKVYDGDDFVDLIFGSGNGVTPIDDEWFACASAGEIFGVPVRFCAAEDLLWSKAFIMERERFDGADVAHLILVLGHRLDWRRLLGRFGGHWRVLLAHLVIFGFTYPGRGDAIPAWVLDELVGRLHRDPAVPSPPDVCRGPLLSRCQYLVDVRRLGLRDARLEPDGPLTRKEIDDWTAAAETPTK